MTDHICTISLTWDQSGNVHHRLYETKEVSPADEADFLALSAPLLLTGQLGVLTLPRAMYLVEKYLAMSDAPIPNQLPIGLSLTGADISLHEKEGRVVHMFYPKVQAGVDNLLIELAVANMVVDLTRYAVTASPANVAAKIKFLCLASTMFFLATLQEGLKAKTVSRDGDNLWLMARTNIFCLNIYDRWMEGDVPEHRIRELARELKPQSKAMAKKLRL